MPQLGGNSTVGQQLRQALPGGILTHHAQQACLRPQTHQIKGHIAASAQAIFLAACNEYPTLRVRLNNGIDVLNEKTPPANGG